MAIYAPPLGLEPEVQIRLQTLREAAQDHRKVSMAYRDATQALSQRVVRPLGCFYWGKVWTLAAWCEVRHDFRSFRLDRMDALQRQDGQAGQFRDEPGKTLADYLRSAAPAAALARLTESP
jgi:predicted DNA-binding transcriptional regulator YafY